MKTLASFDPLTQSLTVTFDSDAQKAFARAAANIADFLEAERKPARSPVSNEKRIASIEAGLDTLSRLGNHPSGQEMTPEALRNGLDAACYAALYCLTVEKPAEPMGQVLVMLATITPFRVTTVSLPPASEVFDLHKVAQTAWNAYEVIRLWSYSGSPFIFLLSLYDLWNELLPLKSTTRELVKLEEELRHSTGLFRFAMHRLAVSAVLPTKRKKSRRPMR